MGYTPPSIVPSNELFCWLFFFFQRKRRRFNFINFGGVHVCVRVFITTAAATTTRSGNAIKASPKKRRLFRILWPSRNHGWWHGKMPELATIGNNILWNKELILMPLKNTHLYSKKWSEFLFVVLVLIFFVFFILEIFLWLLLLLFHFDVKLCHVKEVEL